MNVNFGDWILANNSQALKISHVLDFFVEQRTNTMPCKHKQ